MPIIGVIATEATVRSGAYERAIHRRRNHARLLLRPTPLLVPIIEEGRGTDDPLVRLALSNISGPCFATESMCSCSVALTIPSTARSFGKWSGRRCA